MRAKLLILLFPLGMFAQEFVWSNTSTIGVSPKQYGKIMTDYVEHENSKINTGQSKSMSTVERESLMWQNTSKISKRSWKGANNYCSELDLDSYTDWYLPTKDELKTLINKKRSPKLAKGFRNISSLSTNSFWTSSESTSKNTKAWRIDFKKGSAKSYKKSNKYLVRCARSTDGQHEAVVLDATTLTQAQRFKIVTDYLIQEELVKHKPEKSQTEKLKKGRYEKTKNFNTRVAAQKNKSNTATEEITEAALQKAYMTVYGKPYLENNLEYDADSEKFFGVVKSTKGGFSEDVVIAVPIHRAENLDKSIDALRIDVLFNYETDSLTLNEIIIEDTQDAYVAQFNKKTSHVKQRPVVTVAVIEEKRATQATIAEQRSVAENNTVDNTSKIDTGLFLRGGIIGSRGSMDADYKGTNYTTGATASLSEDFALSSMGLEVSVGVDMKHDLTKGMRIYGITRVGNHTLEGDDGRYLQFGAGVEGYTGNKRVHFIYGALASFGSTSIENFDYGSVSQDDSEWRYLALEPYIGIEVVNEKNGFGGFAKLGYEWRSYDQMTIDFNDGSDVGKVTVDATTGSFTGTAGVQYSF